jgi:hypothetical protein
MSTLARTTLIALLCCVSSQANEPLPNADHWSYQPLAKTTPPAEGHPIDAFVHARLKEKNLQPNPPAERRTLIRRLSFDLHGLPPTPEEIETFLADPATDAEAIATLIDRLLASPHYGERWARHWLDVARYSESQGFERDKFRPNSWRYRDYVVDSLNRDKPYDQFSREQIAGDVLTPVTTEGIIATGFLVAGPWDEVGNSQQSKAMKQRVREEELEGLISATGQTFLGVTVHCARCHDHKFDPIPAQDYYALKAVFEGIRHGERSTLVPAELAKIQPEIDQLNAQISDLEKQIKKKSTDELVKQRDLARDRLNQILPKVYAANPSKPEPTHFLERGESDNRKGLIAAAALSALPSLPGDLGLDTDSPEAERRLRFSDWMTSPQNPLFARTIVNRVWHYHFGTGLVDTPNDLGVSGGKPSHPQLLDWLASEFIREGWSVKKLHRLILTSATWQQSSDHSTAAASVDANNRLLWRFAPKRLEAEAVRDSMLAISGELNPKSGGPSVRPYELVIDNSHFYEFQDRGDPASNRRTLYRAQIASLRDSLLDSLDCPSIGVKAPKRATTSTPVQALSLMNNSFVDRQSRKLAQRLRDEIPDQIAPRITRAFQLVLGRDPTAEELEKADQLRVEHSLNEVCWALLNSTEFIFVK